MPLKAISIFALCGMFIFSSSISFAHGGCDCGTIAMQHAKTQGVVSSAHAATTAAINAQILAAARSMEETMKQGQATLEKNLDYITKSLEVLFKGKEEAAALKEEVRTHGEAAQVRSSCDEYEVSKSKSGVVSATEKVRTGLKEQSKRFKQMVTNPGAFRSYVKAIDKEQVDLFPEGGTLTDQQKEATAKAMRMLTNTAPPIKLTEREKGTMAGARYEAINTIHDLKKRAVEEVFSRHLALIASTERNTDVITAIKNMHEEYGLPADDLPQIKDEQISMWGIFDFFASLRFKSPNFFKDVSVGKEPAYMLKEITRMQSLQTMLMWQRFKEEQSQSMLLAILVGHLVDQEGQSMKRELLNSREQARRTSSQ